MRRTEGGAICLQILFRSGRQRFERINALVVYENTQVQMWACGPAGRADGCDDLPLRNGIAGFGIECTQMRVHRPDAVFMLQRHMIAVGFAVAAIQHRSGRDGQHILSRLGFEINAAVSSASGSCTAGSGFTTGSI